MKDTDWIELHKKYNQIKYNWIRNNYNRNVSQEEFIQTWKLFKAFSSLHGSKGKGVSKKLNAKYRNPALLWQYNHLKTKYNFFK